MHRIDIDQLTEPELVDLNHRIVERLRLMHQVRAHQQMLEFRIGDRVTFLSNVGQIIRGVLTRYNRKSVTVLADDGLRWTVSPTLLRRIEPAEVHDHAKRVVLPMKQLPS